jgi:hypothetical protein
VNENKLEFMIAIVKRMQNKSQENNEKQTIDIFVTYVKNKHHKIFGIGGNLYSSVNFY